ncbi:myo-inositol 2-dehydrogenase [Hoeflea halophila]|uniref:Myo-inositol 2-dehydrogenase n=1 Tax=Hoeflea halophila TaxID=714899 RepID=A0A286IFI2_9HYPH|nr:inositol 2-dehydrogenase [Hoeflea halophila]SOE18406.1 myo-inositol 2-dehydrogenase [Hoeflea halophila]
MRVGLLGAGRIGKVHAQAISSHPESALVAVSDAFEKNAQALAEGYGCQVRSSDEIIADSSIDAVLIATPTDTHSDLIEAAARSGKAVLCEKPVDLSLERAHACLANVGEKAASIMIGFNRRFDPSFGALKTAIDAGEIGKTELLSITSFDPAPPPVEYIKVSGGLFRDMMIHDFDMANFIMGQAPVSVSATGSSVVDPAIGAAGDFDTAVVTLSYADGRIAVIKNSRRAVYGYDQRVEVLGSGGLLQAQNMLENTVVKSTAEGVCSAKPTYFFLERYMPAYKAEWTAFVEAVQGKSKMPVNLYDGVAALAMAEAATRSAHSGQPVKMVDVLEESERREAV